MALRDRILIVAMVAPPLLAAAIVGARWLKAEWSRSSGDEIGLISSIHDPGSLRDLAGRKRALRDLPGERAIVLGFLAVDEPWSEDAIAALNRVVERSDPQAVQVVGVYPRDDDTLDRVAAHSLDHEARFPPFVDLMGALARELGVTQVGEVVVLGSQRGVAWRRVGDDRGAASTSDAARSPLEAAVAAVVAGETPPTPSPRLGPSLFLSTVGAAAPAVNYAKDVAPILQRRCQTCHRPGQSAPFSLLDFDDASQWSAMIREVVVERRMPPWHADARHGQFSHDRRMTEDEIAIVRGWVDAGSPPGDLSKAPPAKSWPTGWARGEPDAIVSVAPRKVAAEGPQSLQFTRVETSQTDRLFVEDRWINGAEVRPSRPEVVHHISVYIVPPGEDGPPRDVSGKFGILGWAPGAPSYHFPPGAAMKIPKGSHLVFETHYTPNGTETEDAPIMGLWFAKERPQRELILDSPGNVKLSIPPRDPLFRDDFTYEFPFPAKLLGLMGHMHLRGRAFRFDAIYPDGRRETLLSVPRYDFSWQTFYWLKEPKDLPRGAKVIVTGWWDNSAANPLNPNPAARVTVGPNSANEMLSGWMFFERSPLPAE